MKLIFLTVLLCSCAPCIKTFEYESPGEGVLTFNSDSYGDVYGTYYPPIPHQRSICIQRKGDTEDFFEREKRRISKYGT